LGESSDRIKMNQQLEDRIKELGGIVNSKRAIQIGAHKEYIGPLSETGWNLCGAGYEEVPVYKYKHINPKKERKKAKRELKEYTKSPNEITRMLARSALETEVIYETIIKSTKVMGEPSLARAVLKIAIYGIMMGGTILAIQTCGERKKRERREFLHQQYTKRVQEIKEKEIPSPKSLEDYVYYNIHVPARNRSFIEFKIKTDKKVEGYRKEIREKLEKGYLTPEHRYYGNYEKVFGKEEWWPKEK